MKKNLSIIEVSLTLILTASALSAATVVEAQQAPSKTCFSLLKEYELALTGSDSERVRKLQTIIYETQGDFAALNLWETAAVAMHKSFTTGDIEGLTHIQSHNLMRDSKGYLLFANLADLGEPFLKYGSKFSEWDRLIEDAKVNNSILKM